MAKLFLIAGMTFAAVAAVIPPIDWLTYIAILCVAVNAFWLGVDVERDGARH